MRLVPWVTLVVMCTSGPQLFSIANLLDYNQPSFLLILKPFDDVNKPLTSSQVTDYVRHAMSNYLDPNIAVSVVVLQTSFI